MEFNNTENHINKKVNTNSKDFLEKQLKELDSDFNLLYERMNERRKLAENQTKESKKQN